MSTHFITDNVYIGYQYTGIAARKQSPNTGNIGAEGHGGKDQISIVIEV
jgi:hypothetical protein